ncbi:hypothetical protein L21SP2_0850 [Salinispira pacifica]|uniref:5'-Nucleotidase C-terminal domain-containing protein n=1 Tax=Salinispira pacifica TaxID=1307761 RepID=V5WF58_9SPIO|nr:hypothetical protein L21SP2_0850 [Salinispira pacifica]
MSRYFSGNLRVPGGYVKFLLVLCVVSILSLSCERSFTPHLDILSAHSLKGQIFSDVKEVNGGEIRHRGFSLLSSGLNQFRSRTTFPHLFIADNNSIHGSPEAYFSRGMNIIELLNSAECDALIVDTRELYFGLPRLQELAEAAEFPMVSANIRLKFSNEPPEFIQPYFYHPRYNILIIGLSSPNLIERSLPAHNQDVSLIPSSRAVEQAIRQFQMDSGMSWTVSQAPLVERPFVLVNAVSHKLNAGETPVFPGNLDPDQIDLLVMGERDLPYDGFARSLVNLPGMDPRWKNKLVLVDDGRSDRGGFLDRIRIMNGKIQNYTELALDSARLEPDTEISELLFTIREESGSILGQRIADSSEEISHSFSGDSELAHIVTNAMLDYSSADFALINSGSMRGGLDQGPVTVHEAYSLLPFESGLYTLEARGDQILEILNRSASLYADPEGEKGFLQGSGLEYAVSLQNGLYVVRPRDVKIGGEPLDMGRNYTLVTSTFLHAGGDGYEEFGELPILREHNDTLLAVFLRYLNSMEEIRPSPEPRIRLKLS